MTVVALAIFNVSTATGQAEDYLYETNNGTINIRFYIGPGGDVVIPGIITGLPVTSIGVQAFAGCTNLTNVTIPNSVTSIGDWAFLNCASLTSVTIPNSVTSIGFRAFSDCSSLTSVTIPNSVTNIGSGAFSGCTSLTSVSIPNSVVSIGDWPFSSCTCLTAIEVDPANPSYSSLNGVLFNKSQTLLLQCPGGKAGYIIPNSVTTIENGAFEGCTSLTSIVIPDSITGIGLCSFRECTSLTSVTIPNSVTSIEYGAFYYCASLTGVYFKGNAPTVDLSTFEGATNAIIYYLPATTGWSTTFEGRPTAAWVLPYPVILTTAPNFGIQTNQFGFRISWATNAFVVVEACTNLAIAVWSPVSVNTLTEGWTYFSDAEWTNYPSRFYRVRQW